MSEDKSNFSGEKKKGEEEMIDKSKIEEDDLTDQENVDVLNEEQLTEEKQDSLEDEEIDPINEDNYTKIDVVQDLDETENSNIQSESEEVKVEIDQDGQENNPNDLENELLDFADLDDLEGLSEDDLKDMQDAIAENLNEFSESGEEQEEIKEEFKPEISEDLELRMQEELEKKKKIQGIKTITKEKFTEYLSVRRNKIVYHALWFLVFNMEDHQAAKDTLYEALKEVTSKNAVEPIEEHKFYFGLGFILRLKLIDQKIVEFKNGKLNIVANIDTLKSILNIVGDPISDRPILTSTEKKTMFEDFLKDDFLDI